MLYDRQRCTAARQRRSLTRRWIAQNCIGVGENFDGNPMAEGNHSWPGSCRWVPAKRNFSKSWVDFPGDLANKQRQYLDVDEIMGGDNSIVSDFMTWGDSDWSGGCRKVGCTLLFYAAFHFGDGGKQRAAGGHVTGWRSWRRSPLAEDITGGQKTNVSYCFLFSVLHVNLFRTYVFCERRLEMQIRSTANVIVFAAWSIQQLIVYQNERREGFSSTSNEGLLANTVHERMLAQWVVLPNAHIFPSLYFFIGM